MALAINFIIWMFCVRYCAYQGSKRVIGGFSGGVVGAIFALIGVLLVRLSRRLLDEKTGN
jgi:formate-dependent nitrite reductase membrane component NrfD